VWLPLVGRVATGPGEHPLAPNACTPAYCPLPGAARHRHSRCPELLRQPVRGSRGWRGAHPAQLAPDGGSVA